MADLFTTTPRQPLAERLRPTTVEEVVGQAHLLGPGKPLRLAFQAKKLHSFILWGPPGVGKTTLGRMAAQAADCEFMALSAVHAGVKDIRQVVAAAQHILDHKVRTTVVFVDEIHAFNKSQQDALLPHVESGLLVLVGSPTENPSFELNNALLSRAQVYVLQPLSTAEMRALYRKALPHLEGVQVVDEALTTLAGFADGDGRRFLNLLEQVTTAAKASGLSEVTPELLASSGNPALRRFDTDTLYDQISALHKSIRGSSPDAALYWLARMLDAGADARYIARRLVGCRRRARGSGHREHSPTCVWLLTEDRSWQSSSHVAASVQQPLAWPMS